MWSYNYYGLDNTQSLSHFGVLGMKWGRRRYQNKNGSLTPEGKKRYSDKEIRQMKRDIAQSAFNTPKTDAEKKIVHENQKIDDEIKYLTKHYKFDLDDGGGGVTKADQMAGARYWKLTEKKAENEYKLDKLIEKRVTDELVEKVGKERVSEFESSERVKTAMKITASLMAIPVAAIAASSLKSSINYHRELDKIEQIVGHVVR